MNKIYTVIPQSQVIRQLKKMKNNKKFLNKYSKLVDELSAHPYTGTGKPEPLKYDFSGKWSRRIDKKNRLIYEVIEPDVIVISLIGHYE